MAITWNDIQNGEQGSSVRIKINEFNTAATVDINNNTINISINASDIATNTSDISDIDIRVTANEAIIGDLGGALSVITVTGDYTLIESSRVTLVDASAGNIVITLPTANLIEQINNIKRIDSSANTVTINSVDGIDDVNTLEQASFENLTIVSNGTQYFIL